MIINLNEDIWFESIKKYVETVESYPQNVDNYKKLLKTL